MENQKKNRDQYLFDTAFVPPRTPTEERLAQIWASILDVDRVGVEDNFFDLDGDSLLALMVLTQIRHHLGANLPLRTLFEAPTIAQLSDRVQGG
jgi:acyl carrier protein